MAQLETISPEEYPDMRKKRQLLYNIRQAQGISHMIQRCRDEVFWTFEMCASYLRKNAMYIDNVNSTVRPQRLMHVHGEVPLIIQQPSTTIHEMEISTQEDPKQTEKTVDEVAYLFHTMARQGGIGPTYKMFNNKPFRESLSIPDRIWNELEPLMKEKIVAIRAALRKKNEDQARKPQQSIPNQYPTMITKDHTKETMLNLVSSMADCNFVDDDYKTDDEFIQVTSAMMVRVSVDPPAGDPDTDIEVRAHFEYTNIPELKHKFYAISDSGADSCVLGKMAKIVSHTGRYASLIGYDPKNTTSGRVPIVEALIKTMPSSIGNLPILLRLFECPIMEESNITLISEYQVREHGLKIDSVARKHKSMHGRNGTQCFCVSSEVFINFEDRGGLMGFELLPVEDGDEDIYDMFTITSPMRWTPRKYKDESFDGYFYDPTNVTEEP